MQEYLGYLRIMTGGAKYRALLLAALYAAVSGPALAQDFVIGSSQAAELQQAPEQQFSFSIARQPLAKALIAFSSVTGIQIIYDTPIAVNRVSPGLEGRLSAFTALQSLLAGSGLVPHELFKGTYTLAAHNTVSATTEDVAPHNPYALQLDTLHVQVPTDVGNHRLFAMAVEYAIQSALQRDRIVSRNPYLAEMVVWLTPTGNVRASSLLNSTGNASLDTAIEYAVRNVAVGQTPPHGLPQPIYVRVSTAARP
jgi:hypothetical protein